MPIPRQHEHHDYPEHHHPTDQRHRKQTAPVGTPGWFDGTSAGTGGFSYQPPRPVLPRQLLPGQHAQHGGQVENQARQQTGKLSGVIF